MQIPELLGKAPLILTLQIIADIYLGHIAYWNDSAIAQVNPLLKDMLPNQPILAVYEPGVSVVAGKVSAVLVSIPEFNTTVCPPEFYLISSYCQFTRPLSCHTIKTQVGQGSTIVYPVSITDRGVSTANYGSVLAALNAVSYSFGFWTNYEIVATRTLSVASMVNPAGNVVAPTSATVVAAASDFSPDQINLTLGK